MSDLDGTPSALQSVRDRSAKRRELLARSLGARSSSDLSTLLGTQSERVQITQERQNSLTTGSTNSYENILRTFDEPPKNEITTTTASGPKNNSSTRSEKPSSAAANVSGGNEVANALIIAKRNTDTEEIKPKRRKNTDEPVFDSDGDEIIGPFDDYFQVLQEEEKIYRGSATFLKGTQSANPHNDYCQHFIDTGQRPQNFIRDSGLAERFDEYPKLKELIKLKDDIVAETASPPMYLKCDLRAYDLRDLGSRFDVVVIEPPLEEYRIGGRDCWSWDQIERLDISGVADTRAFLWLWCGSTPDGLQRGRQCLKRWGFRRCEDICWVKTNKTRISKDQLQPANSVVMRAGAGQLAAGNSLLQRTKEHCLMGIKGTVRRSTDGDFIHANVDIDLIITEEPQAGSVEKPTEIILIAEHFCLGRRRLHLFGRDDTLRPGWLTVGSELTSTNFDASRYRRFFDQQTGGHGYTTGCTERIEQLRPKSPVPMDKRGGGNMIRNDPMGGGRGRSNAANSGDRMMSKGPYAPPVSHQRGRWNMWNNRGHNFNRGNSNMGQRNFPSQQRPYPNVHQSLARRGSAERDRGHSSRRFF